RNPSLRADAWLFGESQSRVVVSVSASQKEKFVELLDKIPFPYEYLGKVTNGSIFINGHSWGDIKKWKSVYDNALEDVLNLE
ncbi:MAG: phosphoribosylformylglycinamidine synthase subunit PurL, partial [Chitinophagales bacterium]|nr:phosphoribosylformylglycinamidine synthase subunit PurL [Chitinophagales bacterium]